MKANICDRCGKTYTSSSKHITRGRIHGSYIDGIGYMCKETIDAKSDLCDDCLDALFDFMVYDENKQKRFQ